MRNETCTCTFFPVDQSDISVHFIDNLDRVMIRLDVKVGGWSLPPFRSRGRGTRAHAQRTGGPLSYLLLPGLDI